MKVRFDEANDAVYFRLDESKIIESEEIQKGLILDFNSKGQVVGVEILGVTKRVPAKELKKLQFEAV